MISDPFSYDRMSFSLVSKKTYGPLSSTIGSAYFVSTSSAFWMSKMYTFRYIGTETFAHFCSDAEPLRSGSFCEDELRIRPVVT